MLSNYTHKSWLRRMRPQFILLVSAAILIAGLAASLKVNKPAVAAQLQNSSDIAALVGKAQSQGYVRVIIGLNVNFKPEGAAKNPLAVEAQRRDIAQTQDALLSKLSGVEPSSIKRFQFTPYLALAVDAAGLEYLKTAVEVKSTQEDKLLPLLLAESVPLIGTPAAWASGFTGAGQTVAILDMGVDKTHPFLSGKVVSEACYSTTDATKGYTSVCPGGVPSSTAVGSGVNCPTSIFGCFHGTHVAGIAAGKGTTFSGVAKDANIIAVQVFTRVCNAATCGSAAPCITATTSDVMLGLERVYALRTSLTIAAVNMSLGGGQFSANCDTSPLKPAIDNLRSAGIATVISSGNSGFTNSMSEPACISTAVSVGSTGDRSNGTTQNAVSSFSNSASFLHLLAPGSVINSSVPGGGFTNLEGTSMAAPHVTGAWAVLKQKVSTASVTEVLTALTSTGLSVTDPRNGITKPRIKVDAAVNALGGGGACTTSTPITVGQTITGQLSAGDCTLADGSFADRYSFSGTAGQQIAISLNSTAFDAFLGLLNANEVVIATDDDSGGGTNARIPASGFFSLPATGNYIILANSFAAGGIGSYTLSLTGSAPALIQSRPQRLPSEPRAGAAVSRSTPPRRPGVVGPP